MVSEKVVVAVASSERGLTSGEAEGRKDGRIAKGPIDGEAGRGGGRGQTGVDYPAPIVKSLGDTIGRSGLRVGPVTSQQRKVSRCTAKSDEGGLRGPFPYRPQKDKRRSGNRVKGSP